MVKTELAVLGGGPGGYTAAFRAKDLGKKVILIDQQKNLGGVCLNSGCIPSKTILHLANIIDEAKKADSYGISFNPPEFDFDKIRSFKNSVIKRLAIGIKNLAQKRGIEIINGAGHFIDQNKIEVVNENDEKTLISFENAIIATGSSPIIPSFIPKDPRIMDSTTALDLLEIPEKLLIIGGGAIGLEMATIYSSFGSLVTIVEMASQLAPNMDSEIIEPIKKYNEKKFHKIMLETKVTNIEPKDDGVWVTFEKKSSPERFDKILVAIGRKPNSDTITIENTNIELDQKGFIKINEKLQTNIEHIYAIGDVTGNPMLAHKATHEGKKVSEIIAGLKPKIDLNNIPNVIYTDPEAATVGLTERDAKEKNIPYKKSTFPWLANGRSISANRKEGITKLLFDPTTKKILGGAIVGPNAGELISEISLAISLGATADKISHVIHPHPTLSETIALASEIFLGTATDFNN